MQRESQARKTALGICEVEGIRTVHTSLQHVLSFFLSFPAASGETYKSADSAATNTALSGVCNSNSSYTHTVVTKRNTDAQIILTQLA